MGVAVCGVYVWWGGGVAAALYIGNLRYMLCQTCTFVWMKKILIGEKGFLCDWFNLKLICSHLFRQPFSLPKWKLTISCMRLCRLCMFGSINFKSHLSLLIVYISFYRVFLPGSCWFLFFLWKSTLLDLKLPPLRKENPSELTPPVCFQRLSSDW